MTKGTLYGIGTGPGDPELLTVKAWRLIGACPVIAYPVSPDGTSFSRTTAAPFIPDDATELAIPVPMCEDREPAQTAYDIAATRIAAHLDKGRDVAFLCAGDPLFYASFMYLLQRLKDTVHVEVIPGVSSVSACAAAIARPLAARNDVFKVLPAPLDSERLAAEIKSADAVAVIKAGRHFGKIRNIITRLDLAASAMVIEAATTGRQKVTALNDVPEGDRPYFSTILIYKGKEPW